MLRITISLILLPAMLMAQPLTEPSSESETNIPRFLMIAEGLYRGGQPDKRGFEFLKQKGIKTVINFRSENDEAPLVKELGMHYVWIPMEIKPWSKIPNPDVAKYFEVVTNPDNYPIFFHCRRGADRTGAMAAFYRIAVQGWDAKKAYSEARDVGMRWWYPAVKEQVYKFRPTPGLLGPTLATQP